MHFGGAYFDYDNYGLKNDMTLAAHFIHSVIWMSYVKGFIDPYKGMTAEGFYMRNQAFFKKVVARYKKEKQYEICTGSILIGIQWFIDSKTVDD